jgi:signal transduction histidine kinase
MMIHLEIIRSKLGARTDEVGRSLEVMGGEIRRLDRVVQGFLRFARPQELKLAPVDLNALLSGLASLLEAEWRPAGVRFELDLDPALPCITGDEELLRQAFLNLIQNAGQAMPAGGRVAIATAVCGGGQVAGASPTWGRDPGRRPRPGLQALLHDAAGRQWHRARAGVPDRAAARWSRRPRLGGGPGHRCLHPSPAR